MVTVMLEPFSDTDEMRLLDVGTHLFNSPDRPGKPRE